MAEEPHDYELTNLGLMPGDIMCHSFSEDYVDLLVQYFALMILKLKFFSSATASA